MKFKNILVLFVIFSVLSTLFFTSVMAWLVNTAINDTVIYGLVLGIIFGLILVLQLRIQEISITFTDKQAFIDRMNFELIRLGYELEGKRDDYIIYNVRYNKRIARILSPFYSQCKLCIDIGNTSVSLTSAKMVLGVLVARLSKNRV